AAAIRATSDFIERISCRLKSSSLSAVRCQRRSQGGIAPSLDDDVGALVDRTAHAGARDRRHHEPHELPDSRHPGTERRTETRAWTDGPRALACLAAAGAAVQPFAGAAVPDAADLREVPLIREHPEGGVAEERRVGPSRIGEGHAHEPIAPTVLL